MMLKRQALVLISTSLLISIFANASDSSSENSVSHDNKLVRVRLYTAPAVLEFEGLGLRIQNLENPYQKVAIPTQNKTVVRALYKNNKWAWAVKWPQRNAEVIVPGPYLKIEGEGLRAGAKKLPQKIFLNPQNNSVDVIGIVPLKDYLVGVLKSEMPLAWPLETLKAQAVAARSYALAVMEERAKNSYHLESSILDQVYEAIHYDQAPASLAKAIQAVDETSNQVLHSSSQKILKSFFHADCGGQTIKAQDVWKSGVTVGTASDASCPNTPSARWTLKLSQQKLEKRLKLGAIQTVDYKRSSETGRVTQITVVTKAGKTTVLAANEFRSRVGFGEMKSTWFRVSNVGTDLVFSGKGFGHGVGLCQWGSRTLGKKGYDYKAILQHYYPLASLN